MRRIAILIVFLLLPGAVQAHPLTDVRFDRTAAVRLATTGIEITYTLEVSPLALHLDAAKRLTPAEIAALDRTPAGYATAYARKVTAELLEKFHVAIDGVALPLQATAIDVKMTDHAVCRFTLHGAWPQGSRERKLTVNDATFLDKPGVLNLTLDVKGQPGNPVELLDSEEPPAKLRVRPLSQLSPEEAAVSRQAAAEIRLPIAVVPAPRTVVMEHERGQSRSQEDPAREPLVATTTERPPDLLTDLRQRGLPALFDSTLGSGLLLLVAFLFGAAHAFTPGHGKTLVAAYLIGERGTVRHAILLASVTTITHTGSVIAVAAVLWTVYGNNVPGRTQGGLQFLAGLLVSGVGLWLLLRRLTGQADHFHFFGGHHHHEAHDHATGSSVHTHSHDHSHDHHHHHHHHHDHGAGHHQHGPSPDQAKTTGGWLRIVLMGLGGGIVPCWDAVLLLIAATALNRVGFALPLLLAFSLGLGTVLVALGIGVVYAYRAGVNRFREERWFKLLPTVSAVFLIAIGFWLCKQAVRMTMS
jgi:ABC-type nickel/cobalt efflux system permease component RcnA